MTDVPVYPLDLLAPQAMEIDTPGGGIEAARSLSGVVGAIDFSGGGIWSVKYQRVILISPDQHRAWNKLRAQLNARTPSILVPVLSDWTAPVPAGYAPGQVRIDGITHGDGTAFSDGATYSQSTIIAELAADALVNAATLRIKVIEGSQIAGGEVFSIRHPGRNWRCYTVSDVDAADLAVVLTSGDTILTSGSMDLEAGPDFYTVGISPPLREGAVSGTPLRFDRPLCLMRLAPGSTVPWAVTGENWWKATPDIAFIESF